MGEGWPRTNGSWRGAEEVSTGGACGLARGLFRRGAGGGVAGSISGRFPVTRAHLPFFAASRSAVACHRLTKPGSAVACHRLAKPACWRVSAIAHAAVTSAALARLRATAGKPAPTRRGQAPALRAAACWRVSAQECGGLPPPNQARECGGLPPPNQASLLARVGHRPCCCDIGSSCTAPLHGGQARPDPAGASPRTPGTPREKQHGRRWWGWHLSLRLRVEQGPHGGGVEGGGQLGAGEDAGGEFALFLLEFMDALLDGVLA